MTDTTTSSRLTARASTASSRRGGRRAARATRRVLLVLAGATLSCLMGAGVASANTEQVEWRMHNTDTDNCWEAATMDSDGNGYWETTVIDSVGNDCQWDARIYNVEGGDWFAEGMDLDRDWDGVPEYVLRDTDQREGFDYVWFDVNEDSVYERAQSLADVQAVASQNASLKQANIEAQTRALIGSMPGVVNTLGELPTYKPVSLR